MSTDSRKVVLYLIDTLEVGGAEKSLLDILSRLTKFRPVVCYLYRGNSLEGRYRAAGVDVLSLGMSGKYQFLRASSKLKSVVDAVQPALIVTTLFRSDIVGRLVGAWTRTPVVSTFVNDTYADVRTAAMSSSRRRKHFLLWLADFCTSRLCIGYLANSMAIAESNARALILPLNRISVIYRGRSKTVFFPAHKSVEQTLTYWNAGVVRVINVARMEDRKGQLLLVDALALLREAGFSVELVLIGDGPYRPVVEKRSRELGLGEYVEFLGTRSDVAEQLREAHVFVSPAEYEGLPGAVVEAMLSGLPVVLSDMNVHREMVEDRVSGWLFERTSYALARTLREVLLDRSKADVVARKGYETACSKFDIDAVVCSHEDYYQTILAKNGAES